jgi:hypothetical protein
MSGRSFLRLDLPSMLHLHWPCPFRPLGRGGRRFAYCLSTVALLIGCEVQEPDPPIPPGPTLYPVHGTVTVDGKPLARAIVVFMPVFSTGTHSVSETKADGTYRLAHRGRPGIGRGDYRVVISYIIKQNGKVADLDSRSNGLVPPITNGRELIPPRYRDFSRTELRAIVGPDCPPINFDLKGPLRGPLVSDSADESSREKEVGRLSTAPVPTNGIDENRRDKHNHDRGSIDF